MNYNIKTIEEAIPYINDEDIPYIAKYSDLGVKAVRNVLLKKVKRSKCCGLIIEVANINKGETIQKAMNVKKDIQEAKNIKEEDKKIL